MKEIIKRYLRIINGVNDVCINNTANLYESRRFQLIEHILHDSESGVTSQRYTNHDIIVSLTTYGKRLNDVAFTIESIMQQTMKPNKIILWLEDGLKDQHLPHALKKQMSRGLEMGYCKDIRSYKKLIPTLKRYPEAAIITIDDDALYDYDLLEHLIYAYINQPQYIHAGRVHRIRIENGIVLPYNKWKKKIGELGPHRLNFAVGVGGILYPPGALDNEVYNEDVFTDICKYADDIWFYAMAVKKGTLVNKIFTRNSHGDDYISNVKVQDIGLMKINTKGQRLNDAQFHDVFSKYGLFDNILT